MPKVQIMSITDPEVERFDMSLPSGRPGEMKVRQFPFDSGVPGIKLEMSWNSYSVGYGTPRHRHTFDQYRYALSGRRMIADGFLEPGDCGFYPEGVHYGPQDQTETTVGLGLQFQGLSGIPYVTHAEIARAVKALKAAGGTFSEGVYTKIMPDGTKVNKDSHAACIEYLTGHKLEFPKGRYDRPIVMKPEGHPWIGDRKLSGVDHKRLGLFGGSGIRLMRLQPGAVIPARREEDAEIRYLIEGTISYGGRTFIGGKTQDQGACMFIQAGADVGEIVSKDGCTFFVVELPMLADIIAHKAPQFDSVLALGERASAHA